MASSRHSQCAGCGVDLLSTFGPLRKWCSGRCRKATLYAGACEVCGAPTSGSNGRKAAPRFCVIHGQEHSARVNAKRHLEYRVTVEAMWADGMTARQIATALDWKVGNPNTKISILRSHGYDLPHRRTAEQIARITAGSEGNLDRARAVYREQLAA